MTHTHTLPPFPAEMWRDEAEMCLLREDCLLEYDENLVINSIEINTIISTSIINTRIQSYDRYKCNLLRK